MPVNHTSSEKPTLHFWLRAEVKELEKRTPLMPEHAKTLLANGHQITVERSVERCVPDAEYEAVGCKMVEEGTWPQAPANAIILGLKELPESNDPLTHTHVFFAHCYKYQAGWKQLLQRFVDGKGNLLDLEFLNDEHGRRVAAFGRSAGFIGMAAGLLNWAHQQRDAQTPMGRLNYYPDSASLINDVKSQLEAVHSSSNKVPKVLVIGALGRCGRGAVDFAEKAGVPSANIIRWDMDETKVGGPFQQIIDSDVFVNCIYLSSPIPPFVNKQTIAQNDRKLSVIVDVSCDTSNPHNPIPVYSANTTFDKPTFRVVNDSNPLDVIAIDHLPSLVPLESSHEFSEALLPHLNVCGGSDVWTRAEALYHQKVKEASS
jgi:saccharopine dehydrogenase (NAD+, L-lysine-forming)